MAGQYILTAKLITADSKPLTDQTVAFFEDVDLFGPKVALLKTAVTDGTGVAAIVYQPSRDGALKLEARFAGDSAQAPQTGVTTLNVTGARSPFIETPVPLASVAAVLSIGAVVLAYAVWITLFSVLIGTALRIRAAGRA